VESLESVKSFDAAGMYRSVDRYGHNNDGARGVAEGALSSFGKVAGYWGRLSSSKCRHSVTMPGR